MSYTIITHSGKVHLDEVLASALLAVHQNELPEEVKRLESRETEELVKSNSVPENTWVLDCGMEFDPEKQLFDHHQDRDMPSAALLVFNTFFSDWTGTELEDFVKLVSSVDTRGVKALGEIENAGDLVRFFGFGQSILLRYFEEDPLTVVRIFVFGIRDKMEFLTARKKASEWMEERGNLTIEESAGEKVLYYRNRPPEELISAIRMEINSLIDENGISAVYGFDRDDESVRTLFRTNFGHDRLDFSQSHPKKTQFCHAGGFFLKFIPADPEEWMSLISESLMNSSE